MDKLIELFSRLPVHPRVAIAVVLVSLVIGIFNNNNIRDKSLFLNKLPHDPVVVLINSI
jgi:hypothetical protein